MPNFRPSIMAQIPLKPYLELKGRPFQETKINKFKEEGLVQTRTNCVRKIYHTYRPKSHFAGEKKLFCKNTLVNYILFFINLQYEEEIHYPQKICLKELIFKNGHAHTLLIHLCIRHVLGMKFIFIKGCNNLILFIDTL